MENNENNNLNELDQLKAQYETLKQQFDQQEIVNDRLMKSSIKQGTDFYRRNRMWSIIMCPLAAIFGLLGIKLWFGNNLSLSLFWVAFMFTCLVIELVLTRKFQRKTLENDDLLVLSHTARSFKKLFSVFTVLNYSTGLILVCGLLMSLVGENYSGKPMMLTFLAVVVGMIVLGISEIRYKTRPCDEIIRQIEAFETTTNKETDFNKKQQWFCIAMIVAFIGLDVWAYTLVGSRLKLPPMWQAKEYVRAADDLAAEGKLEFWEVFTDTVVLEGNVSAVMKQWQQNDSLVVMVANERPTTLGLDETSIHEWKEEEKPQAKVFMLKRATPEGPAISAAILGGKPIVQKVVVNRPRKYPTSESVPIIVNMTPEATQLWYQFTTETTGHQAALSLDGVVFQEWKIQSGIGNGCFFIMKQWSSKEELESFCNRLIKQ